jgi:hypothetical protein
MSEKGRGVHGAGDRVKKLAQKLWLDWAIASTVRRSAVLA